MEIIKGIAVSPGIVIGRVFIVDDEHHRIPRRAVPRSQVSKELKRLEQAIERAKADLARVRQRAETEMGHDAAKIFGFHTGMLSDPAMIGPMFELIREDAVSAEYAAYHVLHEWVERFSAIPDSAFQTKVNDIVDLSTRLLKFLIGEHETKLASLNEPAVILARELTPTQTAGFDRRKVRAFATDQGGRTSHTAIVARALDIPAVVGCRELLDSASEDMTVIVDGDRGLVILDPDAAKLDQYAGFVRRDEETRVSLAQLRDEPAVTTDGVEIELLGNIEFADEIPTVLDRGGRGVGLYRTEFLWLVGKHEPSEDEHFEAYAECIEHLRGRPLVVRTFDLGADKYTQERSLEPERNPFLGLRSIRYCLANLPMFRRQLRAVLRASALGPVRIMFPLITSISELRQAKFLVRDVMEDLAEDEIPYDSDIKIGIMVEVPAAALMAPVLARESDFFSIGTNDLVQYTLAVDRTNEKVADTFNPAHPAVIRLIKDVARAARREGIPVSCCGEIAGEPEFAILLLGLGLRILSTTASSIPHVKRAIRGVSMHQCERIARRAGSFDSDVQVAAYLRDRVRKIIPEAFDGRSGD